MGKLFGKMKGESMNYKVIGVIQGKLAVLFEATSATPREFIQLAADHGFKHAGDSGENLRRRQELRYQPTFVGLCGPMFDGTDTIRYETGEANDRLSC
jgi:hypothetical protein